MPAMAISTIATPLVTTVGRMSHARRFTTFLPPLLHLHPLYVIFLTHSVGTLLLCFMILRYFFIRNSIAYGLPCQAPCVYLGQMGIFTAFQPVVSAHLGSDGLWLEWGENVGL